MRKRNTHRRLFDNKFRDNNASQSMMLFYAGVPHSSVMYNETDGMIGRQFQLKGLLKALG